MNIVLEGPDGSGKSTFANVILNNVPTLTYTPGEGPPKGPGEMINRIERYLRLDNCLFDRHPCVSQPIYDQFRVGGEEVPQSLIDRFYASKPLFIYCYGRAGDHIATHSGDTPEHLAMIEKYDDNIRNAYDEWATSHVPVAHWYSVWDPGREASAQYIIDTIKQEISNAQ